MKQLISAKSQLVLLLFLSFISSINAQYNETLAYRALYYSGTAYCQYSHIESWSCGKACDYNKALQNVSRIQQPGEKVFGYVGYDPENDEIVTAFRGTNGASNFWADFNVDQVNYPLCDPCEVHSGFFESYEVLKDEIRGNLSALIAEHPFSTVLVTGHSLGGALALLGALDIKNYFNLTTKQIKLYTFGQPRVGDLAFSNYVGQNFADNNYYRVTHYDDLFIHTPPQMGSQYKHAGNEVWYGSKIHDGKYKICENFPFKSENIGCSKQIWLKIGVTAHINYLGMLVSGQCNVKQATGTLL